MLRVLIWLPRVLKDSNRVVQLPMPVFGKVLSCCSTAPIKLALISFFRKKVGSLYRYLGSSVFQPNSTSASPHSHPREKAE